MSEYNHLFAGGGGFEGDWRALSRWEGLGCGWEWPVTAVWISLEIISGVKVELEGAIS